MAVPVTWVPDADGFWNVPANWSSNPSLPGAADDVTINVAGVRTITHNTGADTIRTLTNAETVLILGGSTLNISLGGTNTGFLTAGGASAGTLNLNGGTLTNTGGVLTAANGGLIFQNATTITGGTLNTSGTGVIRANNNGNNFLSGVTLAGTLDLASAQGIERVAGGLTLSGATINIGNASILAPQGNQTIGGTGTIVFADSNASNRLNVEAGNLVLDSGITVRGQTGVIGAQNFVGGGATLTNNGTIAADVAGGTITLSVSGLTTNNGTLSAMNGGTLNLNSAVTGSTGSQIIAGAGSIVNQNGVTLSGDMNLSGAGSFRASNNGNNFLSGVTLAGTLDLASAVGVERVAGGLTLSGATINIGNASILAPQGDQTIGGTGTIVFADADVNNRFNIEAGTTTLGSGITVRGGNGIIGNQSFVGGGATLVNQGVIAADVSGRTITVQTTAGTTNQNLMRADNGGTLLLQGSGVDNSAGTLLATNGSTVRVNGITVTGGALNSSGTGRITATNSGNNFFNGTTLNGLLDLVGGGIARISSGGMTVNGRVDIGGAGVLAPQGTQTIDGTGEIVFTDANTANRLNIEAGALTIGAGVTVRGITGGIGAQNFVGGGATLTNLGTINSDGGGTITVNPNGALTNNGLFRVQNGTLAVQRNVTGTGTLQVDGTGTMTLVNGGNTQGRLVMGSAGAAINIGTGNLTINNDYTNAGAGAGNSFNRRAGVSGMGLIVAGGDVAQAITGANVTNGATTNATLTINNVRVGSTTYNYQVGNTGTTGPTLRGAIQTSVNGGNITDGRLSGAGVTESNYNAGGPGGNSGDLGVIFTAASAGALAPLSGQVLNLRSNFENIADQKLNIVLGAGAAAYRVAQGAATPTSTNFGNVHVGDLAVQNLTISNTAVNDGFSESLNMALGPLTGNAYVTSGSGGVTQLAAGSSTVPVTLGIDTSTAGAKAGSLTLNYESDGTGTSGLAAIAVGSQTVNVSGNVYRLAVANTLGAVSFGSVHVGDTVQQALNITNTAAADGFSEMLNASFGASSDARITTSGSISLLAAGASSSSMIVGLDTSAAGSVSGTQVVNFASDGTGTSGLGLTALASQTIGVSGEITTSGSVFRLASASPATPNPVNFGNLRIGTVADQTLSITNTAANDGFSEKLNASISSSGSPVTASGSFNLLGPTATDSTSLHVGLDTSTAGAKVGTATIALVSDGTGTSGLGLTNLPSQTVNVAGNVYRLASPTLDTTAVTLAARRGDASPSAGVGVTNTSPDTFTEGLKADIGTASAGFSASGAIANLAAGNSDAASLSVGLDTSAAGSTAGTATVAFTSTGAGTTGAADLSVGSGVVNLVGRVYEAAVAQLNTTLVDFGIVHVGDSVASRNVEVANAAPVAALNDTLKGSIGAAAAGFSASGSFGGLTAGNSDTTSLLVALDTSTAGFYSGSAGVAFASSNPDMADLDLGAQSVALAAQVNNFADAALRKAGGMGSLSAVGDVYTFDFGNLVQGSGVRSAALEVFNDVMGPSDLLDGQFSAVDTDDFAFLASFFDVFTDLGAGAAQGGFGISFDPITLGLVSDTVMLASAGHNGSGFRGALGPITLRFTANVISGGGTGTVPAPGTLLLVATMLLALAAVRRHGARAH